ncbi:molybdenum cofactor guanylyltransferase [Ancylomarina euxinus]|uniref:Probable molybdenum cofactor guanylyltransferase n=1 Tax=Ancylomarina euxinus TaxID=2283627 RepID=A0A425Y086_9BACT|nr:molybdenum cofactor guanylyltransferase [Ancylomarina euxinus]MCZ4695386.1 molybdenum cofactor guanylyltransferase [Ancylomarina euxinus]MUP15582.1 NTP transferase domain-containing protein [Ancylomarina euxinus]RRG20974.1 molybdenum cofactor guanylyltransferase [Ancylomarina euxinus]
MLKKETKIVGIVLSGGKSSRMGQEKGLVKYQGKALIEYAIETLKPLCHEMVISTANDDYSYLGLPMIADEIPDCGPIGGISTCMKAIEADIYLVISCDVPHVPTQLFVDLLAELNGNAIIPIDETGRKQPLVACYASSASAYFHEALETGHLKMMSLLSKIHPLYIEPSIDLDYYKQNLFSNLNSMGDISD